MPNDTLKVVPWLALAGISIFPVVSWSARASVSPESTSKADRDYRPSRNKSQKFLPHIPNLHHSHETFFAHPSVCLLIVLRRPLSGVNCYEHACGNYTEYGRPLVAAHVHSHSASRPSSERHPAHPWSNRQPANLENVSLLLRLRLAP